MLPASFDLPTPDWNTTINQFYHRGQSALYAGDTDHAISSFKSAIELLNPTHKDRFLLQFLLGLSFLQKKRAIRRYQYFGQVTRAGFSQGVHVHTQQYVPCRQEALAYFHGALALNPSFTPAQFMRGQVNEALGKTALAFQDYVACVGRDPRSRLYQPSASSLFREDPSLTFEVTSISSPLKSICQSAKEGKSAFVKYFALQQLRLIIEGMGLITEAEVDLVNSTLSGLASRKVALHIPVPFTGDHDERVRSLAGELLGRLPATSG